MMTAMFTELPDLAALRMGGSVIAASDEFFAPKENLIQPGKAEWREGVYTDRGKWMDGWETRRRRTAGHDWAIVRLGLPGIVRGVVIDTTWFTGNFPEAASLDGCRSADDPAPGAQRTAAEGSALPWRPLLPKQPLQGNTANLFPVTDSALVSQVRLNIFPDGGVARLRIHGEVVPPEHVFRTPPVDLAALAHGGLIVAVSDRHYGNPLHLLLPGPALNMGDGWETRRRRGPGHDWAIVKLGRRGIIERVELETDYFRGNAPGACMVESCDAPAGFDAATARWETLVPESPVEPDAKHRWNDLPAHPATHVRLNIYPDGGVARLRLIGRLAG